MDLYLGIDVGTTNLKVAAFDRNGVLLAYHSEPTPRTVLGPSLAEIDPFLLLERIKTGLQQICGKISGNIRSIGISSMGEAGILCDAAGVPLYPFIAWYDTRPTAVLDSFLETMDTQAVFEKTGQIAAVKYGLPKLLWLKATHPELYQRSAHWLSVEDWVIHWLTGEYATDYSIAARTMAFDPHICNWSKDVLNAAEIDTDLFPAALPGGTAVSPIRQSLARELGISDQIIVSTGGHDHACAAISVDILEPDSILDSMGTAEVLMMALEQPTLGAEAFQNQYCVYPHCGNRLFRLVSSNQSCGACIEWYLNTFGQYIRKQAAANGQNPYEQLMALAQTAEVRTSNVLFLPFIRGAVENRYLKGVFLGMDDTNTEGDYAKALVDGLGYEIRHQLEGFNRLNGRPVAKVKVVGGPSKASFLMHRKAVTQNCEIRVPGCTEAACQGAAMLGAIAVGDLSFAELSAFHQTAAIYSPDNDDPMQDTYIRYCFFRSKISSIFRQEQEESLC